MKIWLVLLMTLVDKTDLNRIYVLPQMYFVDECVDVTLHLLPRITDFVDECVAAPVRDFLGHKKSHPDRDGSRKWGDLLMDALPHKAFH